MNRSRHIAGFSLVELIVVLFILSILAFFTIPYFSGPGLFRDRATESQRLVQLIQSLKLRAVKENQDFLLHLDLITSRAWVTTAETDSVKDEATDQGKAESLENLGLKGVELLNDPDPTHAVIRFSSQGYCDMALIHMEGEEEAITLKVQPFLPDVEIIQGLHSFSDCI